MARLAGWRLGVDGGGSRTRCWLAGMDGRLLAAGEGGPANPGAVGTEAAAENVAGCARRVLDLAGARPGDVAGACFALAGWDRPGGRQVLDAALGALGLGGAVEVVTDAEGAWAGAGRYRPGAVVVAGTGSIAFGRRRDGRAARAGGWGPLFGDEGGAADLGRQAVAAVLRAADGRGAPTALRLPVCAHVGVGRPEDIPGALRWRETEPAALAAMAPLVLDAAAGGDGAARAIVRRAALRLAGLGAAVCRRLELDGPDGWVAGCGGLLERQNPLRSAVDAALRRLGAAHGLAWPELPAVGGALLLAHAAAGGDPERWGPAGDGLPRDAPGAWAGPGPPRAPTPPVPPGGGGG